MNAHFQNGIAEKAILNLQDQMRKLILHACARWPQSIYMLWPYALRTACYVSNICLVDLEGESKLEKFSFVNVSPSLKRWDTFECLVFSLHSSMTAGKSIPK